MPRLFAVPRRHRRSDRIHAHGRWVEANDTLVMVSVLAAGFVIPSKQAVKERPNVFADPISDNSTLDLLANARELGIARDTVRKYAHAEQPPTEKLSAQEHAKLKALRKSATAAN